MDFCEASGATGCDLNFIRNVQGLMSVNALVLCRSSVKVRNSARNAFWVSFALEMNYLKRGVNVLNLSNNQKKKKKH